MIRLRTFAVFASLVSAGCTIGPRYTPPPAPTPVALKELKGNDQWKMATPSDALLKGKWWELFGDPELNRLEEMVAVDNQSVKQAEAQFRVARAAVLGQHANYYPTIGSAPQISQNYQRKEASYNYSLPISASWEPDLWGRVRLSVENAIANAQVSAADLENLRLSEQALLATDYFLLAAQDMQLKVLADTIESYDKNLQLTMNRHAFGVAARSDITLAQTQLAGAKAQSTDVRATRSLYEHAIAVLTGQLPSNLEIATTRIASTPPPIPVGVPSQLLERRPDIAAGERLVAAANANVGIAETAYYPTLTLSASAGFLSSGIQSLFTFAGRFWSAGPSLSQTLFDFGRRGAALESARASYDSTVAGYRQTVLSAFQEVEDDLASLRYLSEEAVQQQEAVVASQESLDLELQRYRAGTDSYLNVITTQIIALGDQQQAITIRERQMNAAVDLVKAVGGGWDASTLPSGNALRTTAMGDPNNTQKVATPAVK
ncbi:MAG TPA: efflux transporter outer membrane subunit [Bryobacteraceae bacterium]|jgi:NodT family efflux transporter outer membrane factor (OMF) lipoprotein|nr:efflux transporter outer membrane subunit [Bryobacteraceae bacterium]